MHHYHHDNPSVNDAFFQPIAGLADTSPHAWPCPEFPDEDWVRLGIHRVIETVPSGRAFLQEHGPRFEKTPGYSNYFASLRSPRRRDLAADINQRLIASACLPGRLEHISELASYVCFAVDMHWHQAASHDPRHEGAKMAVGHCYGLNLHDHLLRHLAVGEGLHEHDMSVLRRLTPKGLRQGVPKGKRVLVIYDKAGVCLGFWKRCRHECAVYFISRIKEAMVYEALECRALDRSDPRNHGVEEDLLVRMSDGQMMRIIRYVEPLTGKVYEFLTNEMDLPAAVVVELYRRRWDVEKVFDQLKNKVTERKAWATSLEAKETQGHLTALTQNLLLIYEQRIKEKHGVNNEAEDQRRSRRVETLIKEAQINGRSVSTLLLGLRKATQRSVKFIRWLRQAMRESLAEAAALPRLALLYASL
jgi:hypothetical protein